MTDAERYKVQLVDAVLQGRQIVIRPYFSGAGMAAYRENRIGIFVSANPELNPPLSQHNLGRRICDWPVNFEVMYDYRFIRLDEAIMIIDYEFKS